MYEKDIVHYLRIFLVIQHLCGISRRDLENRLYRISFTLWKTVHVISVIFATYSSAVHSQKLIVILWQYSIIIIWAVLMKHVGGSKKFFNALGKLNHNCDDEYYVKIDCKVRQSVIEFIVFVLCDAVAMYYMDLGVVLSVVLCFSMAAHEIEMMFYAVLINCVEIRLLRLSTLKPTTAMINNRYILMVTSQMTGHFQFEVFMLLASILVTSYVSIIMVFLSEPDQFPVYLSYLVWSSVKYLHLVRGVCAAAAGCGEGYRQLACGVAIRGSPVGGGGGEGEGSTLEYQKAVSRWRRFLSRHRPGFSAGDCFHLDLAVPLHMLEVLVSYMLLFLQFYTAYFLYEN